MKYCSHCGKEIMDEAIICVNCGCSVANNTTQIDPNDKPSTGFLVLGLFFPLIGLILYLVYNSKSPKKAKSAGKGALIGFIVSVALSVISYIIIIFSLVFSSTL